jgi:D-aminoacyl-tRNA deacylase
VALLQSDWSKATMLGSPRPVRRGMRAVVARVARAAVHVEGATVGEIGPGLLVLLGVHRDDPDDAAAVMARKLHELRILDGERSSADTGAPFLVVSQFTLYGDTRKGRRPSWSAAAAPDRARPLVDAVVAALRSRGATVATGVFGEAMAVESVNDGPFTVLVETG